MLIAPIKVGMVVAKNYFQNISFYQAYWRVPSSFYFNGGNGSIRTYKVPEKTIICLSDINADKSTNLAAACANKNLVRSAVSIHTRTYHVIIVRLETIRHTNKKK